MSARAQGAVLIGRARASAGVGTRPFALGVHVRVRVSLATRALGRLFVFVTGVSILLTGSLFVTCWRQFRSISRRQRDRLMDVDALKNVLANLDMVALVLRNRPPLPRSRKAMQEELRELLTSSGITNINKRELSVLCSLLMQQNVEQAAGQQGLSVLGAL